MRSIVPGPFGEDHMPFGLCNDLADLRAEGRNAFEQENSSRLAGDAYQTASDIVGQPKPSLNGPRPALRSQYPGS